MKVAFIGHRKIEKSQELIDKLMSVITELIVNENADTFIFGSKSKFDDLCYDTVTELKYKYQEIKRISVRAEYQYIIAGYRDYLLSYYEDTFYPSDVQGAGERSYVIRNQVIVDMCDVLVVYYNKVYKPSPRKKSGTKIAVEYAVEKHKRMINLFE